MLVKVGHIGKVDAALAQIYISKSGARGKVRYIRVQIYILVEIGHIGKVRYIDDMLFLRYTERLGDPGQGRPRQRVYGCHYHTTSLISLKRSLKDNSRCIICTKLLLKHILIWCDSELTLPTFY